MFSRILGSVAAIAVLLTWVTIARAGHDDDPDFPFLQLDHKAIQYEESPSTDPVALLQAKLEKGQAKLEYDDRFGYLPSMLKNLDINVDTQALVFSKTSFQAPRISPARPRAIYFNDQVSIGAVQNGSVFEVAGLDPKLGEVFYTLDMEKQDQPGFQREGINCLQCHVTPASLNVPGLMVSTVFPTGDGSPILRAGAFATDHRIPIEERWGGWYVTAKIGPAKHRGNGVARNPLRPTELDFGEELNPATLDTRFNTAKYLTNMSDIVSLMTLEHQTRMTNLITRIGWETRIAMQEGNTEAFRSRLDEVASGLVEYMLFTDEAPLKAPVAGSSSFTKTFPQRGPRDKQGRSLRDFDLKTRLFRYPLSYMIYSEAFENLPGIAKDVIYQKLYDALSGKDKDEKFARLSGDDKRAIIEIVRDTKPKLPAYWTGAAKQ